MAYKRVNRKLQEKKVEKLKTILDFVLMFNLLSLPMYISIHFNLESFYFRVLESTIVCKFFNMLRYDTICNGNLFIIKHDSKIYSINVSWDSTGWKSLYAFFSLIIATPLSMKRKKLILPLGVLVIFFVNLFRIFTTVLLSLKFGVEKFGILHTSLWSEGMIIIVIFLWMYWLLKEKNNIGEIKYIIR